MAAMEVEGEKKQELTEEERDAYSRQIAAFGVEMMMRLKTMDVLVVGLQGLGMEAAKNLVLSGPRSLTVHDPTPASVPDLGLNFFLSEEDAKKGTPRDLAAVSHLKELNPRVKVRTLYSGQEGEQKSSEASDEPEKDILRAFPLPGSKGLTDGLTEKIMGAFSVVLFAGNVHTRETLLKWNRFCRSFKAKRADKRGHLVSVEQPIGFVNASTFGAMGFAFSDFGDTHHIFDMDGEPGVVRAITDISNDKEGGIITIDDQGDVVRGIEVDDDHAGWVQISGVNGMDAKDKDLARTHGPNINEAGLWKYVSPVFKIEKRKQTVEVNGKKEVVEIEKKTRDPYKLRIGDTSMFNQYANGGTLTQKKKPITRHYRSLESSILRPNLELTDMSKWGRAEQLHIAVQGVYDFYAKNKRLPTAKDVEEVFKYATEFNSSMKVLQDRLGFGSVTCVEEVDKTVVTNTCSWAAVELQPLACFFGGLVAQEVMKWTGKFNPLNQTMIMDAFEVLPDKPATDLVPLGENKTPSRYDHMLALFGTEFHQKVRDSSTFMVGCGALGCEYFKNFAMLGLATGKGTIYVTDNDRIEVSNLNRQFLFREGNVGQMKSEAGAAAAKAMNKELNIDARQLLVMPKTENVFNDEFWMKLDFVTNALDNVKARQYVDGKCVIYEKALLESGTQGTKCNSQVILPHATLTYTDGPADNDDAGGIPMCTLRSFPNLINHCVEWARVRFTEMFDDPFADAKKFVANKEEFLEALEEEVGYDLSAMSTKADELDPVLNILKRAKSMTFEDCVEEAWRTLHVWHRDAILDLTHQFPKDAKDKETGASFWSGHKRFPNAAEFDVNNPMYHTYVISVANILAVCYGIQGSPTDKKNWLPKNHKLRDPAHIAEILKGKKIDEWTYSGVKTATSEAEAKEDKSGSMQDKERFDTIVEELTAFDVSDLNFEPADFEKDCDANFHIDFISAATNLRAWNYQLDTCSRDQAKVIAGRIIPAILTATSSITGLMSLELLKIIHGKHFEQFRDSSNNLGTNNYAFSEPTPAIKHLERKDAERQVKDTQKWIEKELAAEKPRLKKLAELKTRLQGGEKALKEAPPAVPEGFTKWDKLKIYDPEGKMSLNEVVAAVQKQIEEAAKAQSTTINAMTQVIVGEGKSAQILFDVDKSKSFEEAFPGFARNLTHKVGSFRKQAERQKESHEKEQKQYAEFCAKPLVECLKTMDVDVVKQVTFTCTVAAPIENKSEDDDDDEDEVEVLVPVGSYLLVKAPPQGKVV